MKEVHLPMATEKIKTIRFGVPTGFLRFGLEVAFRDSLITREELDIVEVKGEKEILQMLLDGSLDMGRIASIEAMKADTREEPIAVVAAFDNQMVHVIVGSKSIKSPIDLRNRIAGGNGFGDYTDQYMRAALNYLGLTPDKDVAVVASGKSAERRKQLADDQIQATIVSQVQALRLRDKGHPWLVQMADVFPQYQSKVIVAGKKAISENHQGIKKVLKAMIQGCRYLDVAGNDKEIEKIVQSLNLKEPDLAMSQIAVRRSRNPLDDGFVTMEGFGVALAEAKKKDAVPVTYDVNHLFNFEPLREAQVELGLEQ
jgi:ABC-type nitrate/sulfonate/bicarbonate transport system substrate-binding protein